MLALITVAVLAILLKIFPSAALLATLLWVWYAAPLVEGICREFGSCREPGYAGVWVFWISFLPLAFPALGIAWKWWFASERRRLYLNLFIFAIGAPAAIIFSIATSVMPEPN
jgi:hypothetical protein